MTLLCLLSAVATFVLFGLATDPLHQRWIGTRLRPRRKRLLKCLASLGVVLCLLLAFAAQGPVYGAILWLGALSFGAAASFLILNFAPDPSRNSKPSTRERR